jgi:hypothetical protein
MKRLAMCLDSCIQAQFRFTGGYSLWADPHATQVVVWSQGSSILFEIMLGGKNSYIMFYILFLFFVTFIHVCKQTCLVY